MKLLLSLALSLTLAHAAERPPNIVFILADDLGITDINAYARHFTNAKPDDLFFETPHLDKLVADGIAFTQSYPFNVKVIHPDNGAPLSISVNLIWICQVIVGVCRLESVATSLDFRLMIVNF